MAQFASKKAIANTPHSPRFTNSITENDPKVNTNSENSSDNRRSLNLVEEKDAETKIIHGYTLNKNANVNEDLLEELRIYDPTAEVSADGRITVYHRTSKEGATAIRKTGIMRAKEDALFFSSKSEGYASDYGDTVLTFKIPSTQLRVNDIFDGEVHFDMSLKRSANGWSANVKPFIVDEDVRYALEDSDVDKSAQKSYTYSKEQYDSFGWAREANAMTKNELDDLYSKIQEKSTLRSFKRNSNGEAIVEVNNEPHANLAVDNVFAFVTGTKNKFFISKVIRFDADTATEMEILKEVLYDGGSWSDYYCSFLSKEGLAREYRKEDFGSFEQYQREVRRRSGGQESRGVDQSNREREEHRNGNHKHFGADGEVTPSVRKRYALDIDTVLESTKGSVMLNVDQEYKPNFKDKVFSGWTAAKIAFVNEQAGIEAVAKHY